MPIVALLGMLIEAAPTIYKLGSDAIAGFHAIVAGAKLKAGSPEEEAALDRIERRMHELDIEVANAPEPD